MNNYFKVHNPEVKPHNVAVFDTFLTIQPHSTVVVSEEVGDYLNHYYAYLEVTPATLEEYQDYRAKKDEVVETLEY